MTRTLVKRLNSVIPSIIHNSQKAVPGRHINQNIHIVQDLIDLINKNEEKAAFLFFDQEKAFDRMSHKFIIKTLKTFGFGEKFINWVKILCNGTKSFVKVNGFETEEFDIERGLRQGCSLSALLYVVVAEVLGTEIRSNRKIQGYKYGDQKFKSSQYADDLQMCITNLDSLTEIFRVFIKYELATNAKINKSKTEALWVGTWKNRTDSPFNLNWRSDFVKFLGVYVGNKTTNDQRIALANLNFGEIEAKMANKLAFWKGLGLSLKGKVRVVNMFVLSMLFYRLEVVDITKPSRSAIERKIKSFIWNDRIAGRVEPNILALEYEQGGLQLYDIDLRIKTMRIKWLEKLTRIDEKEIERYLVDRLIGEYRGISGLRILNHDIELNKFPRLNFFYRNALKIWRSMNISFEGSSINAVKDELIYYNKLLVNNNNETFKFFSLANNQPYIPKYIRDLPITCPITSISIPHRAKIAALNMAFWKMQTEKVGKFPSNCYSIADNNMIKKLEDITFKEMYRILVDNRRVNKIWEPKWNRYLRYYTLDIDEREWAQVWNNAHNSLFPFEIQSTIWTMLHLNFYCGYKEKLFNYGDGKCKLCGEIEEGSNHIVTECEVLKACINDYQIILSALHEEIITRDELAFGLVGNPVGVLSPKMKLRNFLTFIIRHVIFKKRYKDFGGKEIAKIALREIIKAKIKNELIDKWVLHRSKGTQEDFVSKYLIENMLGYVENGNLIINL